MRRVVQAATLAVALGATLAVARFGPIRAADVPPDARALVFVDRNGALLGTVLGRDDRHTVAVPLDAIAPAFLAAVVATEDRRFFTHGGIDAFAAVRAIGDAARSRRLPRGASTLTMQLARLLVPVDATAWGKIVEVATALRLEAGMSKDEILAGWCNRAPMGSNVYGVEAAALTYFGVDAARLDLAQAATLAALPNDPTRLDPYAHPAALAARRRYVLARMRADGIIDATTATRAADERLTLRPRSAGIVAAPHLLFALAPRVAPERTRVRTTIDAGLQRFVAAQVRDVVARLGDHDVGQGAAIVVENRSGDVLAYVGSRDYFDDAALGRNDGVSALRQPGSALKPFLYELALERRAVRPQTILADVPTTYALGGGRLYAPHDYAARFLGPVRVRIALADSLNVPAVRVLSRVGVAPFLARLHALGFAHLTRAPDAYGLGLTLGAGEVSLAELARAYATAARGGAPTALRYTLDDAVVPSAAAGAPRERSWALVTDMLADDAARAAAFGTNSILTLPFDAAVKTGTSSDFRDTWTAGYTRDFTVAVWVGNFDGRPMRGVSGVTGAGPLWRRIVEHLHARREPAPFGPPPGFARATMCARSGVLPGTARRAGVACDGVREWFDRRDLVALANARVAPLDAGFDEWLAEQPPRDALGTRILFPHDGERFVAMSGHDASQALRFVVTSRERPLDLRLNGVRLVPSGDDYLWTLKRGSYELVARAGRERSAVRFDVVAEPRRRAGFTTAGFAKTP